VHAMTSAIREMHGALGALEPGAWSPDDAATMTERLARLANAVSVARTRMAVRAAEGNAHRRRGFADASDWLAHATGSTVHASREELEVVRSLEASFPATMSAVEDGAVSLAQAAAITNTAATVPACEDELLDAAARGSLGAVRDLARTRRLEAIDRDELYATQRAARAHTHWRDELGMVCGSYRLTPDVGVPLVERIDREADRLRRDALRARTRRGERVEPRATFAADALVRMADGTATTKPGDPVAHLVLDWSAHHRGHVHEGERCHVIGGGPIPVSVAREMMEHAFLKVVLTDGVEVQRVLHVGRHIPAALRTALELGPPPAFAGISCVEADCERHYGLEWDHRHPVAAGGPTSADNLEARCGPHHREKTQRDRAAGLLSRPVVRPPP
jgi:hypothetical protein